MKTATYIRSMPKFDNFLQQGVRHTRQSVNDIDESYNNEWDILAELIQNSVDAVRESDVEIGEIILQVDCQNKIISIKDNGIGINNKDIMPLLALFGTNKKEKEQTIGEKGVGLKFAMFSCNSFTIKTSCDGITSLATVKEAYNWKVSADEKNLPVTIDEIGIEFLGTEITLQDVRDCPMFDLSIQQLKYVLRTRTAIGNTNNIFDLADKDIIITLKYYAPDGVITIEKIPFKYLLPTEIVSKNDKISLEEFYDFNRDGGVKDDHSKRLKLKNKIVFKTKIIEVKNRCVYAYACLVPGRSTWLTLNNSIGLATEADFKDEIFLQNFSYATFQPGIFTSVKGMPTGVRIEAPITGQGGTWGSILMIFEDRKLKFDIGRKSIHGKTQKIYQEYARDIFNEFRTNVLKYVSGDVTPESTQWDRDEIFAEVEGLIDLKNKNTKFIKSPKDQEASVAGMFFECIGNGIIKGIEPLVAGYKNKYDLYAKWERKRIVIEFKSNLYKIIKDFSDATKMFNEIDAVVCWDVSEEDEQAFKDIIVSLEDMPKPTLLGKDKAADTFPNATHILRYSNFAKPIYVLDLKIILKDD